MWYHYIKLWHFETSAILLLEPCFFRAEGSQVYSILCFMCETVRLLQQQKCMLLLSSQLFGHPTTIDRYHWKISLCHKIHVQYTENVFKGFLISYISDCIVLICSEYNTKGSYTLLSLMSTNFHFYLGEAS